MRFDHRGTAEQKEKGILRKSDEELRKFIDENTVKHVLFIILKILRGIRK